MRADRVDLTAMAIAVVGAVVVLATLLPAFQLAIEAYTTGVGGQTSYRYETEVGLALDLRPLGLVPLFGGLLLVSAVVATLRGAARWWLTVVALVVMLGLGVLYLDTSGRLRWSEGGVIGYEEPRGGPLLQPALDELHVRARRSPEASDPSWTLLGDEYGYASRGQAGWRLLGWSTLALVWLTTYRVARIRLGWLASLATVAAATLLLFVWALYGLLDSLE